MVRLFEAASDRAVPTQPAPAAYRENHRSPPQQRLKSHALPQQFEGRQKLICRAAGRAMASTRPAENRQAKANPSAAHPAADDIDRPFGVGGESSLNDRAIAPPLASKTCFSPKTPEMPILSRYFAFRDRN